MKKPYLFILIAQIAIFGACKEKEVAVIGDTVREEWVIDEEAWARLDSTLKSYVDMGQLAGVSALIYEQDKEVYFNTFGYADRNAKIPMSRNTIVQIYSMTKPITGTALMTLYDKGAFNLDDPVAQYASEFEELKVYAGENASGKPILEEPKRPMTIRDLTRHTAGFGRNQDIPGLGRYIAEADALNRENTLPEMAVKMGQTPLYFHPGEQWEYGPSVDVQAFLVEKISGQPYAEYVKEHVLDPLKMADTRYFVPEHDRARFSAMYRLGEDGVLTQLPDEEAKLDYTKHWPLTRGGSGLTSTLDDYMKFARMLVHGGTLDSVTILKPTTVDLMATNHLAESVTERSFLPSKGKVGFGIDFAVRLEPPATAEENNGVVGEFFWDGAASTLFWVDPVNNLTAVLFVQLFPYDPVKLHKNFRDAVYGPLEEANP